MKVLIVHEERSVANSLAEILRDDHGDETLPLYDSGDAFDHLFQIRFDMAWISVALSISEELATLFSVLQSGCDVILFGPGQQLEDMKARNPQFGYVEISSEEEKLLQGLESVKCTDPL
jgi:hypothetical protein